MNWRFFPTIVQSKKALAVLLIAAVVLFVFGLQKETRVETKVVKKGKVLQSAVTPTKIPTPTKRKEEQIEKEEPTTAPQETTPTPVTVVIQVTQMQQEKKKAAVIQVSVSGGNGFSIEVGDNANHCDVLTKAQAEGKIRDLVMKFDTSIGSNAVYKINGLGKDNQVWWTYSVNGQDPPKGCSYIKANDGDTVSWKYIGS